MQGLRYLIGLLTLAGAALGAVWLVSLLSPDRSGEAYVLRLEFRDAQGIKPGAFVRYRGVRVGYVRSVDVGRDGDEALLVAVLDDDAVPLARQTSRFWIVTPRFEGLTGGATGLDTLVRDAYLAFLNDESPLDGPSERLPSGSLIVGSERPFVEDPAASLPPLRAGDLAMTLLAKAVDGVDVGSTVRFRGLDVGEVRRIALAASGDHIELDLRIEARYRRTVREGNTRFWIARPRVSGALLSGLSVKDLSAALEPFIGFRTAPGDRGTPAPDGWRTIALESPPDDEDAEVPPRAVERPDEATTESGAPTADVDGPGDLVLVEVAYEAVEEDWFNSNDQIARRGRGVLFVDRSGRTVVLTARSVCDGAYVETDWFGSPDIAQESIRVVLPGGSVLRAGRQWIDPRGADLALLVLERAVGGSMDAGTDPGRLAFEAAVAPGPRRVVGPDGRRLVPWTPAEPIDELRGAPLFDERGIVVELVGQVTGTDERPTAVDLSRLPRELRPRRDGPADPGADGGQPGTGDGDQGR